mgnify:CR=1 FL=1
MGSVGRGKFGVKNIYNMIKRIDIGGIERQLSVSNMADGSMYGMVGARHLDGNIRPAQGLEQNSEVSLADGDKLLYVHRYGDYEHYIMVTTDGELVYTDKDDRGQTHDIGYIGEFTHIASIGNALVVSGVSLSHTSSVKSIVVWVWQNGQYVYKSMPAHDQNLVLFEVLHGAYGGRSDSGTIKWNKNYFGSGGTYVDDNSVSRELGSWYNVGKGMIQEDAWSRNVFVDAMFVRYGLRMSDGSYAMVSPPLLFEPRKDYIYQGTAVLDNSYNGTEVKPYMQMDGGYSLNYRIYADDINLIDRELIPYIDIFISEPIAKDKLAEQNISRFSISPNPNTNTGAGNYTLTFDVPQKGIEVKDHFVYYRVDSIDVSEMQRALQTSGAYGNYTLEIGHKMSYLRQLPTLERVMSPSRYDGNSVIVYNNRLHIGGVTEYLAGGYGLPQYSYAADEDRDGFMTSTEQVVILYYSVDGEAYVTRSVIPEGFVIGDTINKLLSFPDSRVTRMVIAWTMNTAAKKIDVLMREHPMDNMSYYYNSAGIPVEDISLSAYNSLKSITIDNRVFRSDVLKVSELNNPLVWPNDKTYTVGSGSIVSMAVATKAMSQGQFGQYPLYVFTSEGVYAMLSGGGDVLYSNVAPVNRHIVENAKTVCAIDDAVVFGTRQGLFVMSGGDAVCISGPLDDHGVIRNGRGVETVVLAAFFGAPPLTEFITMRELVSQGCVSYDYANEEILLYNPGRILCYAYSLKNKMWQSYNRNIHYIVDNYPELCVVTGNGVMKTMNEDGEVVPEFLLVTNGMQLSDSLHSKRILRMHLLSHFGGDGEVGTVVVAVACSNDGEEYVLTYKREYKEVKSLHHITLPHSASGYRYISLIIYGKNLNKLTYINGIEVEYEDSRKER